MRSLHRLTYHRTNHDNIHVRVHKEEGSITRLFDLTVLNDLDHLHPVMNTIGRVPQNGDKGISLKLPLKDKLIEHNQCVNKCGQDLRKICHLEVGRGRLKKTGVQQAGIRDDVHVANDPK